MLPFPKSENHWVPNPFGAENTFLNLAPLLFCAMSLLAGFFITYSLAYAFLILAALFAIVLCLKPELGLYLMIAFIPVEAIGGLGESLTIIKLVGWVVLAGWILNIALTKKQVVLPREGKYLIAFTLWGLVSAFWAVDPDTVIQKIPTYIQLLGFYVLVINIINTRDRIYHLFWALIIGSIIASIMTLSIYFAQIPIERVQGVRIAYEARLSIGDPNHFLASLLLVIPFLLLSVIFASSSKLRLYSLGGACLIMISFFLGMSRTGIVALATVIIAMVVKYRRYIPRLIIFIPIAMLAGLYFMPEYFWQRMSEGFSLKDRGAGRIDIWLVGWNMVKENPLLGVGLDGFHVAFDYYRGITNFMIVGLPGKAKSLYYCNECFVPHNIYLEAVADLGIVGGALLFLIVVRYLSSSWRAVKFYEQEKDRTGEIIAMSAILAFLGLLVFGLGLGLLYYKYFWVSMALIEVVSLMTLNNVVKNKQNAALHS